MIEESHTQKIWDDIKGKQISLFALPPKLVSELCEPVIIPGTDTLFLKIKISSVLPALEEAVKGKYTVVLGEKYCEVKVK